MTRQTLDAAIFEAKRFLRKAAEVKSDPTGPGKYIAPSKESAAAKRASLDLSRALSEMRKPG
jgi:hypothetical protein